VTAEAQLALFLQTFGFEVSLLLTKMADYAFYLLLGFIIAWILFQVAYDAVGAVVNPIMMPVRSRIPPLSLGGFALDLSPIIVIFGLYVAHTLVILVIRNFIRPVTG
jgi:YggT family protein